MYVTYNVSKHYFNNIFFWLYYFKMYNIIKHHSYIFFAACYIFLSYNLRVLL